MRLHLTLCAISCLLIGACGSVQPTLIADVQGDSSAVADDITPTVVVPRSSTDEENFVSSAVDASVDILTADSDTDEGMQALSSFTLHHDPDLNCLYHDEPDNNGEPGTGGRVAVVWPFGYTAVVDDGEVAVLDATGTTVARTNIAFTIGGGGLAANTDHCDTIGIWIANGPPTS